MIYKLEENYHPYHQLPYCCVPAILQWILYRHGLDILDQETIGADLGLRLPLKGKAYFSNKSIKFLPLEPKNGYGTQIEKEKYSIQSFFNRHKIPLMISKMHLFNTELRLKKFIIKHLNQNNDIILRYNNKVFKDDNEKSYGHFSVIVDYNTNSGLVTIGDPELPHFKQTTLKQILFSMSKQIDGMQRGLYIIVKS